MTNENINEIIVSNISRSGSLILAELLAFKDKCCVEKCPVHHHMKWAMNDLNEALEILAKDYGTNTFDFEYLPAERIDIGHILRLSKAYLKEALAYVESPSFDYNVSLLAVVWSAYKNISRAAEAQMLNEGEKECCQKY